MSGAGIDTRKLVAEIEDEVRRKRATGELPADFERELDNVFARYAPVGALDLDFDQVLEKIEENTVIDTAAPLESSRPVVPQAKLVVRKAIGWNVRYVASQVSSMVQALSRALRLLGERVDALEAQSPAAAPEARAVRAGGDLGEWHGVVAEAVSGLTGRVLHGEAGAGSLVTHLVQTGVVAYGVEPDDDTALEGASRSLDIRADEVAAHLKLLEPGALDGIVLSGCVDRLALGGQLDLLDLATTRLAGGGRLIVLGTDPGAWGRARSAVQADLAPGRPLHADTWVALLESRGFEQIDVRDGAALETLQSVPDDVAGAHEINANVALLNARLFRPPSYAVVATKQR
jgi:hypothetical protein